MNTRKNLRKVIAINPETGDRKDFDSIYMAAKSFGVGHASIIQALDRDNGFINGWRVYDSPDRLRKKIAELEERIKMLEK